MSEPDEPLKRSHEAWQAWYAEMKRPLVEAIDEMLLAHGIVRPEPVLTVEERLARIERLLVAMAATLLATPDEELLVAQESLLTKLAELFGANPTQEGETNAP